MHAGQSAFAFTLSLDRVTESAVDQHLLLVMRLDRL